VLTITDKQSRWFKLMYTLQGKPDQHVTCISRSVRVWPSAIRISHDQRIVTFCVVINRFEQIHYPWKEGFWLNSHHDGWSIHGFIPSFSPTIANEAVGKKSSFCWQPATRLTGPTSPTCDQYDQYLLMWDNLLGLNWHRRGLQPWRCRLFKSHSSIFPTDGPPLFT
jgi:hypothetical protein